VVLSHFNLCECVHNPSALQIEQSNMAESKERTFSYQEFKLHRT
jgi:hypothetical protein